MELQAILFRLYSDLETPGQEPLYDVLELDEGERQLHRRVSFKALDLSLIKRIKQTGHPVILLIPTEITREVSLGVIPGSTGKALQAAPFLVEESLSCNLDSTHIVFKRDAVSKRTSAVVIQHHKIQQCLDNFHAQDITVGGIYRDLDTLKPRQRPGIRITRNRAIIETSIGRAAISLENTRAYLEAISDQLSATEPDTFDVLVTSPPAERTGPLPQPLASMPVSYTPDHWFPEHFALSDYCINLAQARYAPETSRSGLRQPHWISLYCLYLSLVVLSSTYYGFGEHFARVSHQLSAQQVELYQQLFPQDRKIVNLRAQFTAHLRQLEDGLQRDRFSELFNSVLDRFGVVTHHAIGAVRNIHYQSSPPILSMEVAIDSAKILDEFVKLLAEISLAVRIESISQQGELLLGHIQVSTDCSKC